LAPIAITRAKIKYKTRIGCGAAARRNSIFGFVWLIYRLNVSIVEKKNDVSLAYIIFLLEIGYDKKNAVAMANRDRDANHLFDFYFSDRLTAR
ncbi:MAG: hypothetical protein ACK5VA_20775, partial [Pseudanabaena sp.]